MANKPMGVHDKDAYAEEPCNSKGLCTVLKGDERGQLRPSTQHIRACFDELNHAVLVNVLRKKIRDERFLNLIRKLLNAGYMDLHGRRKESLIGSPQGGILSPILANAYHARA